MTRLIIIALTFIALAFAFTPSADACHHGGGRKPIRKGLKAAAKLVLPCR